MRTAPRSAAAALPSHIRSLSQAIACVRDDIGLGVAAQSPAIPPRDVIPTRAPALGGTLRLRTRAMQH